VSINPRYRRQKIPVDAIQAAVAKALTDEFIHPLQPLVDPSAGSPYDAFPYTPARLADASRRLGVEGVVGISVSGWIPPPASGGEGRVDLLVSFADSKTPSGHWIFSGAWSASSTVQLERRIGQTLPLLLSDMHAALAPHPLRSLFSRRMSETPLLTFIGPKTLYSEGNSIDTKAIDLSITAIDDEGIETMSIENEAMGFARRISAQTNASGDHPIFLSAKVHVPLAHGANAIVMKARSATPSASGAAPAAAVLESARSFKIHSTAMHEPFLLAIGSDAGAVSGTASNAALVLARSTTPDRRFTALAGASVRVADILPQLGSAYDRAVDGDPVVLYVAGRLVSVDGRPMLDPQGGPPGQRREQIALEDLQGSASMGDRLVVLDLCGDAEDLPGLKEATARMLSSERLALARIVSCDEAVGALAAPLAQALASAPVSAHGRASAIFHDTAQAATRAWPDALFAGATGRADWPFASTPRPPEPGPGVAEQMSNLAFAPRQSNDASPANEATGFGATDYYVVGLSSASMANAQREADLLRRHGSPAGILLGVSGYFSVVVAQSSDVKGATEALAKAKRSGLVPGDAYIIPPARIARVLKEIQP